jgi:hypothetical protein
MIASYYEISRAEHDKVTKLVEKEEFEMEQEDNNHKIQLNAFTNKYKHIEYDHDYFVTEQLRKEATDAVKDEDRIREQREDQFMEKKTDLKRNIKEEADANREAIDKKKDVLEKRYNQKKENLDDRLQTINMRYGCI